LSFAYGRCPWIQNINGKIVDRYFFGTDDAKVFKQSRKQDYPKNDAEMNKYVMPQLLREAREDIVVREGVVDLNEDGMLRADEAEKAFRRKAYIYQDLEEKQYIEFWIWQYTSNYLFEYNRRKNLMHNSLLDLLHEVLPFSSGREFCAFKASHIWGHPAVATEQSVDSLAIDEYDVNEMPLNIRSAIKRNGCRDDPVWKFGTVVRLREERDKFDRFDHYDVQPPWLKETFRCNEPYDVHRNRLPIDIDSKNMSEKKLAEAFRKITSLTLDEIITTRVEPLAMSIRLAETLCDSRLEKMQTLVTKMAYEAFGSKIDITGEFGYNTVLQDKVQKQVDQLYNEIQRVRVADVVMKDKPMQHGVVQSNSYKRQYLQTKMFGKMCTKMGHIHERRMHEQLGNLYPDEMYELAMKQNFDLSYMTENGMSKLNDRWDVADELTDVSFKTETGGWIQNSYGEIQKSLWKNGLRMNPRQHPDDLQWPKDSQCRRVDSEELPTSAPVGWFTRGYSFKNRMYETTQRSKSESRVLVI